MTEESADEVSVVEVCGAGACDAGVGEVAGREAEAEAEAEAGRGLGGAAGVVDRAPEGSAAAVAPPGRGGFGGLKDSSPGGRRAAGLLDLGPANAGPSPVGDPEAVDAAAGGRGIGLCSGDFGNAPVICAGRNEISGNETEPGPGGMTSRFCAGLRSGAEFCPSDPPRSATSAGRRLSGRLPECRGGRGSFGLPVSPLGVLS